MSRGSKFSCLRVPLALLGLFEAHRVATSLSAQHWWSAACVAWVLWLVVAFLVLAINQTFVYRNVATAYLATMSVAKDIVDELVLFVTCPCRKARPRVPTSMADMCPNSTGDDDDEPGVRM